MSKRILTLLLSAFLTFSAFAQDANELQQRLRELEAKLADLQTVKQQIDALSAEIEALKTRQAEKTAVADTEAYGLGAAASKVYRSGPGVSIGGYGEFLYQNAENETATADSLRAVVYTGYKFNDRVLFNSELEVEHANLERGGNVELEFAYLDYLVRPEFNVRGGLVLVPVGLTNEQHEPTAFLGARRPRVENVIIPTTWMELGGGVFGEAGPVSYRAYVVTGLDAANFNGEEGIREGRQAGGEAKAEDFAIVGRADWQPIEGTFFGGSLYTGDSGQDSGIGGRVTLAEVHAQSRFRGVQLRGLYSRGSVDDAAAINMFNGLGADEGIGSRFGGWYVEGGYEIGSLLGRGDMSLTPYARYEAFDTQRRAASGFTRNPENDQTIFTIGMAFKPISQTVIKVDYQNVENEAKTGRNQWNVALGYIF